MPLTSTRARLMVVDDDPQLLEVLDTWLSSVGYQVRTARDGIEALAYMRHEPYDVILTDLKMPGLNGLHLMSVFKDLDPSVEIIFLTGEGTMDDAIQALRQGRAFDFLLKPLKNLHQLNVVVAKALERRAIKTEPTAPLAQPPLRPWPGHIEALTTREIEIVELLARGLDNVEIADKLCLSHKTIKNNLSRMYEKLQVKNRTQAILFCQDHGLL